MPIARKHLVDQARPGAYHVINRCVRRAHLCGDAAEHRRDWIRDHLTTASQACAIHVLTYAVMNNHFHLVVRTDPEAAAAWGAREVAIRWGRLYPKTGPGGLAREWTDDEIDAVTQNDAWIDTRRQRLASLSWFMKAVKERVARRANKEDDCTGHFWEGRFRSIPLLDQAAVISCMAYVDLNPVRAAISDRPERSDFTGIQDRCNARQDQQKAVALLNEPRTNIVPSLRSAAKLRSAQGPEHGLWIAPIAACAIDGHQDTISSDDYIQLVDATGRIIRGDKRGAIPPHLLPILDRLHIDVDAWLNVMRSAGALIGTAIGDVAAQATEALRRGAKWIVDRTAGLYRKPIQT
jgi:REP element-mobilizing transposase RayT